MLDLSDAFRESADILIKLTEAQKDDPDLKSPENKRLQVEGEDLWYNLSTIEMDLIRTMSADLWYLEAGGPRPESKEPDEVLQSRFSQAKVDGTLIELAVLLHECPKLATGIDGARIRYHLWKTLGYEEMARRFEYFWTREQFKLLRDWWKETETLSSIGSSHPAYQGIIKLGMPVVPILLKEMRDNPNWWGPALESITGENPCKFPEMSGRLDLIAKSWVDWGIERGHLK